MNWLLLVLTCLPGLANATQLRIGTAGHYPPYYLHLPGAVPQGLDVDLLQGFCREAGYDCTWTDMPLDQLIAGLAAGRLDVAAGGIGATPERDALVDFTCPYYALDGSDGALYATTADINLAKAKVAVSRGSIYETAMQRAGMTTRPFDTEADAAAALATGLTDAFFGSATVLIGVEAALPADRPLAYLGTYPTETTGTVFAVAETAADLRAALDTYLARESSTGRLAALQRKWLDVDQGDVIAGCLAYLMTS